MRIYPNLLAATKGLLGESVAIARESGVDFVIVGGWSPYYLNSAPIPHPGSRDVDILFRDADKEGALRQTIINLIEAGYIPSAKHPFQVLRTLNVAGTDFVFNVDLLHPSESKRHPAMFVHHFEFPVPSSEYRDENYFSKSIQLPESSFLFDGYSVDVEIDFDLPDDSKRKILIPLMNETGTIVTKSASAKSSKRKRDAFDIYLAVSQAQDYQEVVSDFRSLRLKDRDIYNTLYSIREAVDDETFYDNTSEHIVTAVGEDQAGSYCEAIKETMDRFFQDVNLPYLATRD